MLDTQHYPGSQAELHEIVDLAEIYFDTAEKMFSDRVKGEGLAHAPARFCAIHAIELFLNAFLKSEGDRPAQIRGRLHNLCNERFISDLRLKKKTAEHLREITERREYLIARYAPDRTSQHTQINRLQATLREVRKKTRQYLDAKSQADHDDD
ncbi:MAG: hypothetical protein AAF919_12835 [Pseudomonadota bacterium]